MTSPTQRTLAALRSEGWYAAVVEHWNAHARLRQDLFGIGDVLAVRADRPGVLMVQCTTRAHVAARVAKILEAPVTPTWIAAGNGLEVWGWAKRGPRGKRKVWTVTRRAIRAADVRPGAESRPSSHRRAPESGSRW